MIRGLIALAAYIATVPLANWMIANIGTQCFPDACVVPVWPGIYCPSGSLIIGLGLVLRDVVQRALGAKWSLYAIVVGTIVSALVAPAALVIASATAFAISELVDFAVYTPLYRHRFVLAVALAGMVGLVVDSMIFLQMAFGSQDLLPGLVLGKLWMVLASLPFMVYVKRYYERIEAL